MNVKEYGFDKVKIMPPAPGRCQVCAADHAPEAPHNRDSLYYQMSFYQKNGRFPTWKDAMSHCTEPVKEAWLAALREHHVPEEDIG